MSRTGSCETCGTEVIAGQRGPMPRYCPTCLYARRLAASGRWKARNPDHIKTYRDAYYLDPENREDNRQRAARRRKEKAEEVAVYRRRQYLERQQATNTAAVMAYRAANPGKHAEIQNRRRARELAQFVAPVDPEAIRARDKGLCGICGEPVAYADQSLDHVIPFALGGTHEPDNVQLAHRVCNSRKGARTTAALRRIEPEDDDRSSRS